MNTKSTESLNPAPQINQSLVDKVKGKLISHISANPWHEILKPKPFPKGAGVENDGCDLMATAVASHPLGSHDENVLAAQVHHSVLDSIEKKVVSEYQSTVNRVEVSGPLTPAGFSLLDLKGPEVLLVADSNLAKVFLDHSPSDKLPLPSGLENLSGCHIYSKKVDGYNLHIFAANQLPRFNLEGEEVEFYAKKEVDGGVVLVVNEDYLNAAKHIAYVVHPDALEIQVPEIEDWPVAKVEIKDNAIHALIQRCFISRDRSKGLSIVYTPQLPEK